MKKLNTKTLMFAGLALVAVMGGSALACGCDCLMDAINDPATSLEEALNLGQAYILSGC